MSWLKRRIFGAIGHMVAPGGQTALAANLKKPFEWKEAVVYSFCTGCGFQLEINQAGAAALAQIAGVTPGGYWQGYYFETRTCVLCGGPDKRVGLKKIPD